jgi:hypothetical protein
VIIADEVAKSEHIEGLDERDCWFGSWIMGGWHLTAGDRAA